MVSALPRIGLAVSVASTVCGLALWQPAASAEQARGPAIPDATLQVLADVVLVESKCGQLNVDYGKLFAYAERNGIRPVEILPLGERRAAFDAAFRRRALDVQGDRLCGALAQSLDATIPGVFTSR
jgi:hypothetical protein